MYSFSSLFTPLSDHSVALRTSTPVSLFTGSPSFRPIREAKEEVEQSVQRMLCFSPFKRDVIFCCHYCECPKKRIQDESLMMMMIMTTNPVSAGRLQCFLFICCSTQSKVVFVQLSHLIYFKDSVNASALMMSLRLLK